MIENESIIGYDDIMLSIESDFESYMSRILDKYKREYYYWTLDFFKTIGGLSFSYFELNKSQKREINNNGACYFSTEDISFSIEINSNRNNIRINNYAKLFVTTNDKGKLAKKGFIEEYVFWNILRQIDKSNLLDSKDDFGDVVEKQKNNFLITYVSYLISKNIKDSKKEYFKKYKSYRTTTHGTNLLNKLDDLIENSKKGIKTQDEEKGESKVNHFDIINSNEYLRTKIMNLYVLNSFRSKIHFIFYAHGGEGKEELRELLDKMSSDKADPFYRGQANSSWKLDSSLTRDEKYNNEESQLYYDILSLKPDAFYNDSSVYERLITMQHYGMPTRLLDITRNPLIAIYFACSNMDCKNIDGNIFIFKPDKESFLNFEDKKLRCITKIVKSKNPSEICKSCEERTPCEYMKDSKLKNVNPDFFYKHHFIKGIAKNQRIHSQSGDFIFVGLNGFDKSLYELPKRTIIIDAGAKKLLLEQLESLNIHGGTVYPDLSSMSKYIKNRDTTNTSIINKDNFNLGNIDKIEVSESIKRNSDIEHSMLKESEPNIQESSAKYIEPLPNTKEQVNDSKADPYWTLNKKELLTKLAKEECLDEAGLKKLIDDYLFSDKISIRGNIASVIITEPPLLEKNIVFSRITEKVIKFLKEN